MWSSPSRQEVQTRRSECPAITILASGASLEIPAPDGRRLGTIEEVDAYVTPRNSPDQSRVAVGRFEGRTSDIWILEGSARTLTRLTTTARRESLPVWSPNSQRLAVAADLGHGGGVELQIVPIAAAEAPTVFHTSTFTLRPVAWSGDGRILFQRVDHRDQVNLLMMAPEAGAEPLAFRAGAYNYIQAAISPDGRHVAYASDLSGRFEVYVEESHARESAPGLARRRNTTPVASRRQGALLRVARRLPDRAAGDRGASHVL